MRSNEQIAKFFRLLLLHLLLMLFYYIGPVPTLGQLHG